MTATEPAEPKPKNLTEHERFLLDSARSLVRTEPLLWIEENLWILTKGPKIVPFRLNFTQEVVYRKLRRAHADSRPCRLPLPQTNKTTLLSPAPAPPAVGDTARA